jgi:hypothetical protein
MGPAAEAGGAGPSVAMRPRGGLVVRMDRMDKVGEIDRDGEKEIKGTAPPHHRTTSLVGCFRLLSTRHLSTAPPPWLAASGSSPPGTVPGRGSSGMPLPIERQLIRRIQSPESNPRGWENPSRRRNLGEIRRLLGQTPHPFTPAACPYLPQFSSVCFLFSYFSCALWLISPSLFLSVIVYWLRSNYMP